MTRGRRLFIIGTQGIPARYGGLETFAEELSTRLVERGIPVTVSCEVQRDDVPGPTRYRGVDLLPIRVPGNHLRTIVADRDALRQCRLLAKPGDVVYLLGYGVGPFGLLQVRRLKGLGVSFWLNPDGLEWRRPRWSPPVRGYLRFSEWLLLRAADLVVCDAEAIREHHLRAGSIEASSSVTIEYGARLVTSVPEEAVAARARLLSQWGLVEGQYYTYVGRFVPDNNLEVMVEAVLDRRIRRKLLILARHDPADAFFRRIHSIVVAAGGAGRVVFSGGIYDRRLLTALRRSEFAYLHGHEVGGTNPALVEAMGLGSLIVALDTPFNREVLGEKGLFFEKNTASLVDRLVRVEQMSADEVREAKEDARDRVRGHYNWERIADEYEKLLSP